MAIRPIHGHVVLGTDKDGHPYSVYDSYEDDNKFTCKDRLVMEFGQDDNGQMVVRSIERNSAAIGPAIQAAREACMPREMLAHMEKGMINPEKATYHGIEFEIGGPATGRVVDLEQARQPEVMKALSDARENYSVATFFRVDFDKNVARQAHVQQQEVGRDR
ncbi:MAG: hypothetical protein INF18_15120 [Methylobacterium sp.]|nr:hypothetical protein [Methylobacterium sp.]MCA3640148.1 hypothetical protein [Methylobacterium sp.]